MKGVARTFSNQDKEYLTQHVKQSKMNAKISMRKKNVTILKIVCLCLEPGLPWVLAITSSLPTPSLPHPPLPHQVDLGVLTMTCQQIEQSYGLYMMFLLSTLFIFTTCFKICLFECENKGAHFFPHLSQV